VAEFQVTIKRGPRTLRARQVFTSVEDAREYVRQECQRRQLKVVYESTEASAHSGAFMVLTSGDSFWIDPLTHRQPVSLELHRAPPSQVPAPDFEDWLTFVFDRLVPDNASDAWYWHEADPTAWDYSADPGTVVSYLGRLFEGAPVLLERYSDAQVAQGLEYLINNSLSNYMFPLMDPDVEWPARLRAIAAMYVVFEQIFEPNCDPELSHVRTDPAGAINPLNGVCYMWWDVCPLHGHAGPTPEEEFILPWEELVDRGPAVDPHAADLEAEILGVLERSLQLNNVACQEAALHGLGHRYYRHAARVEGIVNRYLDARLPSWPDDEQSQSLRGYALAARSGRVQ
jgi:hypothetical protein